MKNWKTTVSGIVSAVAGFVSFKPELFSRWPAVVAVAQYIVVGGIAALGIAAKDFNNHSTLAEVERASDNGIGSPNGGPRGV